MEPFVNAEEKQPGLFYLTKWMKQFPRLTAGFTARTGGVSSGEFDSLNCALHVGDQTEQVIENRRRVAEATGFALADWTCAEQVHDRRAAHVSRELKGSGNQARDTAIQDTDAIMTNEPGIFLTSFYADCGPLYFYDPVQQACALAHAGWKGTVLEIARATAVMMRRKYGSRPEDLHAAIGPSIGGCCYEVDERVIGSVQALYRGQNGLSSDDYAFAVTQKSDENWMLDLKQLNRQIMIKAGILPTRIEISTWCTGCRSDLFFSHRKENGKTGRMASWIGMK